MTNNALQELQELLEEYGFRRFVKDHFDFLHTNTLRHERLGKELVGLGVIDEGERKICMERSGNKDRNIQFYNLLIVREAHWELLVALYFSNNNGVLRFIGRKLREYFNPVGRDDRFEYNLYLECTQSSSRSEYEAGEDKMQPDSESALFCWNAIIEENLLLEADDKKM